MSAQVKIRALVVADGAHAAGAKARFLGLSVAERVVRNLLWSGVSEIAVVGERSSLPDDLSGYLQPGDLASVLAGIKATLGGDELLLVVAGDVVYHPNTPSRLLEQLNGPHEVALAYESADHPIILAKGAALAAPQLGAGDLGSWVRQLARQAAVAHLSVVTHYQPDDRDALFAVPFRPNTTARATRLLMKLNWRPHDGIIAGLLNKHISAPISVLLSGTKVTPNQMTTVAFLFALAGIGLTAVGSYQAFLWGAALVQLQSILDGCDGELARMRYLSSRFGAWYDTVVDDVIGVLWVVAVGFGAYRITGRWEWFAATTISAGLYTVALSLVYFVLIKNKASGHQDFVWFFEEGSDPKADYPDKKKIATWAKYVVRRDFYVLLFLLLALLDLITVVAVISSIAATAWFVIGMVHFSKRGFRLA